MQKCKHLRALNGRMTMAGVGATIVAAAPAAGGAAAAASSHFMCEGCSKMATTFLSSAVRLCIRKCMPVSMCVRVCVCVGFQNESHMPTHNSTCCCASSNARARARARARAQAQVISFGISSLLAFE